MRLFCLRRIARLVLPGHLGDRRSVLPAGGQPWPGTVAAIQNAFLIGVSWLLIPFLGVIKAHTAMLVAFGSNALAMIVLGCLLSKPSATALLLAFNASFAITDTLLIGTLVRRFGTHMKPDRSLLSFRAAEMGVAVAGLAYALGIWADKVVMWLAHLRQSDVRRRPAHHAELRHGDVLGAACLNSSDRGRLRSR